MQNPATQMSRLSRPRTYPGRLATRQTIASTSRDSVHWSQQERLPRHLLVTLAAYDQILTEEGNLK